eukprot:Partr_v1_DN28868_c1_g1_i4_m34336
MFLLIKRIPRVSLGFRFRDAAPVKSMTSNASEILSETVGSAVSEKLEHPTVFVIIRRDLSKSMDWSMGSVIGQACHAVSAVLWENRDHADVCSYMADIRNLRKVTLKVFVLLLTLGSRF